MFTDKKTLHKIWLNPGLNLTIFRGTGPHSYNYLVRMRMIRADLISLSFNATVTLKNYVSANFPQV